MESGDKRTEKRITGDKGEDAACNYLKSKNYEVLFRNFACKLGEIDIIAYDKNSECLVFAEVKTRSSSDFGLPCEFVGKKKQKRIKNTANIFLSQYKLYSSLSCRMDILEILIIGKGVYIRHIEDAF